MSCMMKGCLAMLLVGVLVSVPNPATNTSKNPNTFSSLEPTKKMSSPATAAKKKNLQDLQTVKEKKKKNCLLLQPCAPTTTSSPIGIRKKKATTTQRHGLPLAPPPSFITLASAVTIYQSDGGSYSGTYTSPYSTLPALEGDMMSSWTYKNWPGGFSCSTNCFFSSLYIGSYLWLMPSRQDMIVRVHRTTGAMTGWNTWPRWLPTVSYATNDNFGGAAYDSSRSLFWLAPTRATYPAYVTLSGATGFCNTAWPGGFSAGSGEKFIGAFFKSPYLWMVPSQANMVVRTTTPCNTPVPYRSFQLRRYQVGHNTQCCDDGAGLCCGICISNKPEPRYKVRAWLAGTSVPGYTSLNLGGGVSCGTKGPYDSLLESHSGTLTTTFYVQYQFWEDDGCGSDWDYNTGCINNDDFMGSGTVTKSITSFSEGTNYFTISHSGGYWMSFKVIWAEVAPSAISKSVGYSSWPSGFSRGTYAFNGGLYDQSNTAYLVPTQATHLIKLTLSNGAMVGYQSWPSGFSGNTYKFARGSLDGTNVWLAPRRANMIVKVRCSNGAMEGYNNWPNGVVLGTDKFYSSQHDGKYAWFVPEDSTHMIRVEEGNQLLMSYDTFPTGWSGSHASMLDFVTGGVTSMWAVPWGTHTANSALTRLFFHTGTPTFTMSLSPSLSLTETPSLTFSKSLSHSFSLSPSHSLTLSPSLSLSASQSLSLSASLTLSLSQTQSLSQSESMSESESLSMTLSTSLSFSISSTFSESLTDGSETLTGTFSETNSDSLSMSETGSLTDTIGTLSITDTVSLSSTDGDGPAGSETLSSSLSLTRLIRIQEAGVKISNTTTPQLLLDLHFPPPNITSVWIRVDAIATHALACDGRNETYVLTNGTHANTSFVIDLALPHQTEANFTMHNVTVPTPLWLLQDAWVAVTLLEGDLNTIEANLTVYELPLTPGYPDHRVGWPAPSSPMFVGSSESSSGSHFGNSVSDSSRSDSSTSGGTSATAAASSSSSNALLVAGGNSSSRVPFIYSMEPSLPFLRREIGTTHLTLNGTNLDLLPSNVMIIGPFAVNVTIVNSTSAVLGPVPTRAYSVAEIEESLPHVISADPESVIQGTLQLVQMCDRLAELRFYLSTLPKTTMMDISDFAIFPNSSMIVLPQLHPTITFPEVGYILQRPIPTVEADGLTLEDITSGAYFTDVSGAQRSHSLSYLDSNVNSTIVSSALDKEITDYWHRSNSTHHNFSLWQPAASMGPYVNITLRHQWGVPTWRDETQIIHVPVIRPALDVNPMNIQIPSSSKYYRRQHQQIEDGNEEEDDREDERRQNTRGGGGGGGNLDVSGSTSGSGPGKSSSARARRARVVGYGVRVTIASENGSPKNVSVKLLVESYLRASDVTLEALGSNTPLHCTTVFPNQECWFDQLTIHATYTLDFVVVVPRYYKNDLTVIVDAGAPAAKGHVTKVWTILNGTDFGRNRGSDGASSSAADGNTLVAAAANTRSVFGLEGSLPCIDALLFAWILFLVALIVLSILGCCWSRDDYKTHVKIELRTADHPTYLLQKLEKKRAEWLNGSVMRSLLLQNKWLSLFAPCHDQCAASHAVSTFSHVLTLLWLAAVLTIVISGGSSQTLSTTDKMVVIVITTLAAQGLSPLLSFYYYHYRDTKVDTGIENCLFDTNKSTLSKPRVDFGFDICSQTSRAHIDTTDLDGVTLQDDDEDHAGASWGFDWGGNNPVKENARTISDEPPQGAAMEAYALDMMEDLNLHNDNLAAPVGGGDIDMDEAEYQEPTVEFDEWDEAPIGSPTNTLVVTGSQRRRLNTESTEVEFATFGAGDIAGVEIQGLSLGKEEDDEEEECVDILAVGEDAAATEKKDSEESEMETERESEDDANEKTEHSALPAGPDFNATYGNDISGVEVNDMDLGDDDNGDEDDVDVLAEDERAGGGGGLVSTIDLGDDHLNHYDDISPFGSKATHMDASAPDPGSWKESASSALNGGTMYDPLQNLNGERSAVQGADLGLEVEVDAQASSASTNNSKKRRGKRKRAAELNSSARSPKTPNDAFVSPKTPSGARSSKLQGATHNMSFRSMDLVDDSVVEDQEGSRHMALPESLLSVGSDRDGSGTLDDDDESVLSYDDWAHTDEYQSPTRSRAPSMAATYYRMKREEVELSATVGSLGGKSMLQLNLSDGDSDAEPDYASAVVYHVTPYRTKGHMVNALYIIIATVIAVVLGMYLTPQHNNSLCPSYLVEVVPWVLAIDIVIVQPLIMLMCYGYRWLVSDPENGCPLNTQLHPRDCLVRDEYSITEEEEEAEKKKVGQ